MHMMCLLSTALFLIFSTQVFAHEIETDRNRQEIEKEILRKEVEEQKKLDRETYPDLSKEERRERDREIEKAAKELF